MLEEIHVRARVDLAEHAVEVERIGAEIDVVALRQHDLEDVSFDDVLFGDLDGLLIHAVGHRAADSRHFVIGLRRRNRHVGERAGEVGNGPFDATDRCVVCLIERVDVHPQNRNAFDEVDTLTPVIERSERADDAHCRVGQLTIVAGHIGKPLDLAHDVVTEIAHDATLQRRQIGDDRRAIDPQ